MTKCKYCGGHGKLPRYTQSGDGPYIRIADYVCAFCNGTGSAPDPLLKSHTEGDADGLGGCRAVFSAMVMIALIAFVVWLLTATQPPSILS